MYDSAMSIDTIQPTGWQRPKGYSNGKLAPAGARMLFVAGQVGWDEDEQIVGDGDFVAQFEQALKNVVAVVREAGGGPEHVVRMTLYVTSKEAYLGSLSAVGKVYREVMGKNLPVMTAVQVAGLVEAGAMVEIEATAALPGHVLRLGRLRHGHRVQHAQ